MHPIRTAVPYILPLSFSLSHLDMHTNRILVWSIEAA
jgi:hypothetical protein